MKSGQEVPIPSFRDLRVRVPEELLHRGRKASGGEESFFCTADLKEAVDLIFCDTTSLHFEVDLGYKQLMHVESCWRSMKSGLRTRPIFHWEPHRISARVTVRACAAHRAHRRDPHRADVAQRRAMLDTIKVIEYEPVPELRAEAEALLRG